MQFNRQRHALEELALFSGVPETFVPYKRKIPTINICTFNVFIV